jgi:ABC-type nitrate/sulfonate/bicarbonate transport system substrate-binding protein
MAGQHPRTRFKRANAAAAAIVALVFAAACGSSSSGSGGGASSSSQASLGTLSIAIAGASSGNAPLYIAQQNGYFKQHGVTVDIINAGSAAFTEAASGKVDMSMTGTTAGLAPIIQGRQTSTIYTWGVGPDVAGVVVKKGSPIKSLADLAGKTVSSEGSSGSSYGTTKALSDYVQEQTGKGFTIIPLATLPDQADQVIAGRTTAAVGLASIWAPYVLAGQLELLVNPGTSPQAKEIFGDDLINLSIWGLPSKLAANRAAVTAFLAGMLEANKFIDSHTNAQVAQVMATSPLLAGNTVAALTYAFSLDRPFVDRTQGKITEQAWNDSLKQFATWGLGISSSNPDLSYAKAVDMSYLDAAAAES